MSTCRHAISDALRQLKVIGLGEGPHVDQLSVGVGAIRDLLLELHEARGPLRDVDISANWIADQNTRNRIEQGLTIVVTLPNSVPTVDGWDPYDYGFVPAMNEWGTQVQGSTGAADNVCWVAPTDGARIEIVGTTSELFFYRADINQWIEVYGIRLDDELPLNARYNGPFGTLLAERLMEDLTITEPTPGFAKRVATARSVLFTRPGVRRKAVKADYF